jgi:hypothetical protein
LHLFPESLKVSSARANFLRSSDALSFFLPRLLTRTQGTTDPTEISDEDFRRLLEVIIQLFERAVQTRCRPLIDQFKLVLAPYLEAVRQMEAEAAQAEQSRPAITNGSDVIAPASTGIVDPSSSERAGGFHSAL